MRYCTFCSFPFSLCFLLCLIVSLHYFREIQIKIVVDLRTSTSAVVTVQPMTITFVYPYILKHVTLAAFNRHLTSNSCRRRAIHRRGHYDCHAVWYWLLDFNYMKGVQRAQLWRVHAARRLTSGGGAQMTSSSTLSLEGVIVAGISAPYGMLFGLQACKRISMLCLGRPFTSWPTAP